VNIKGDYEIGRSVRRCVRRGVCVCVYVCVHVFEAPYLHNGAWSQCSSSSCCCNVCNV